MDEVKRQVRHGEWRVEREIVHIQLIDEILNFNLTCGCVLTMYGYSATAHIKIFSSF